MKNFSALRSKLPLQTIYAGLLPDSANRLGFQSVELWASGPHLHLEWILMGASA